MEKRRDRFMGSTASGRFSTFIVVMFILFLGGPLSAAPVVIDFEDLITSGPNQVETEVVISNYADKGITFNGVVGLDYSKGDAIPGFAHSGTKAIEQCYSREFCTTPIEMNFTSPQRRVKVWVGYRGPLSEPRTVLLRGISAGGTEVGRAATTFYPSTSSQPIRKSLEITLDRTSSPLTKAQVNFSPEGIFTTGLAVDDVEFDVSGGPPPCPSLAKPVVSLDKPENGKVVQVNDFTVQGSISSDGPLEDATLEVWGGGTARSLNLLGSGFFSSSGGAFGPLRIPDMLFPGTNQIYLYAANCQGFVYGRAELTYQVLTGVHFKFLDMEITQAIQDLNNSVPLLADKRTVVRVYFSVEGPVSEIRNVTGTLTAFRQDLEPPGGPVTLQSLNSITVNASTDMNAKRRDINGSLNFELPPEWISAGFLHMRISGLDIEGSRSPVPCDGCDNLNAFGRPGFYEFQPAPAVRLKIFSVPYQKDGKTYEPRGIEKVFIRSWLGRAYPTATVITSEGVLTRYSGTPDDDFDCENVNFRLSLMRSIDRYYENFDDRVHYYALVSDEGGFMRGCSTIPGTVGSGPTGTPGGSFGWDTDFSYADWYGGHELGHMYGREHPDFVDSNPSTNPPLRCVSGRQQSNWFCDNLDIFCPPVDEDFPYPNGHISGPSPLYFGFDVGDDRLVGVTRQVYIPDNDQFGWTDMMTYCQQQWISPHTYTAILDHLRSLETSNIRVPSSTEELLVMGEINLTKGSVSPKPFLRLQELVSTERPQTSDFSIDLLDPLGNTLASYPFEPKLATDVPPDQDLTASILEVVPFIPGTSRIIISNNNVELASQAVSPNAPDAKVLSPNGGEVLSDPTVKVEWDASDTDGDPLTYVVLYSSDGGSTWQTVGVDILDTSFEVNLGVLPGTDQGRFRVIATDGVNTGMDDSDGDFSIPPKAPEVSIITPADKAKFSGLQTVVFNGETFDVQDSLIEGDSLQWTSDLQGFLGTGRSISVTGMVPGIHVVTLEAINSRGVLGYDSIEIEIASTPILADAGPDRFVPRGATVILDGSNSQGAGTMVYSWTLLSKPLDSTAVLSDADQAQATFVADLPGEYVVQLWIKDATEAQGIDRVTVTAAAGKCDLSPDDPGMLATHDMIRFLSWTGTLPGTVGSAVFQWRNGNGAARRYWIYESLAGDWLFFFRKNRIPKYDPGKPLAIHNNNYLAIAVPRIEFERWFWCGMPLYDIFGRFKGYGCHPEWGPDKLEILAPWVQQRIDESTPYVDGLLEQAFGGTCP